MATHNLTYQQLVDTFYVLDNCNVGDKIRITDYVTTVDDTYMTTHEDVSLVRSLGHPFDIIVTVIDINKISLEATAVPHEGDTYFSEEDLSQWQLLYTIDEDTTVGQDHYDGKDIESLAPWSCLHGSGGKGAIFWMKDEYGNEAWFDFKNIQILRYFITGPVAISPSYYEQTQHEAWAQKIKNVFATTPISQNITPYIHNFLDYWEEESLPEQNWEDIYTTVETGTRLFVVLEKDADGWPIMIAQVGNSIWCHTFGRITSVNDTETIDLTLGGYIENAVIISQTENYNNELPMSIFIVYGTAAPGSINIQQTCSGNTININCTNLTVNSSLRNSILMKFDTLYIEGICDSTVVMEVTGSHTIYATEYDVLYVSIPNYWRIPFESFERISYEVRIYGATGDTPITLQGGSNPINTEEDKTEEISYPLRTQSGYVRIIADAGFDYSDLLPEYNMSRFVELRQGTNIVWRGFLKAQNFNINYLEHRVSLNLPIIDPLTILDSVDFAPSTQRNNINMAGILFYCFSILQIYEYSYVDSLYIDNTDAWFGNNAWMRGIISTMSFYKTDNNGNLAAKYSCKEVLTNMMTMFGMTLRMSGANVYITSSFNHGKTGNISLDNLKTIAEGTAITGTITDVTEKPFPTVFKGTSNYMKLLQGCRNAIVSCEQNLQNVSWGIPSDEIADKYYATNTPTKEFVNLRSQGINVDGYLYTLIGKYADAYNNKDFSFRGNGSAYLRIWQFQEQYPSAQEIGPYYQWTVGIMPQFVVETKYPLYLKNCIINITIEGGIYKSGYIDTNGNQNVRISLNVGNYFYSNSTKKWYNYQVSTNININNGNQEDTRDLNSKEANYEGFGAIVDSTSLSEIGKDSLLDHLKIYIQSAPEHFIITGMNVSILPNVKSGEDYSSKKEYKIDTQNIFSKKISKNLIFLPSNIETPVQNQVIGLYTSGGADYDPCQKLVENLIDYGSKTRRLYHLELPKQNLIPTDVVVGTNGTKYTPISISRKWVDDKDEVILMETN